MIPTMLMRMQRNSVLYGLILAAAVSRLVPHAPNFTAVGAIALFSGATIPSRWRAIVVPLVAMAITDLILGLLVYDIARAFRHALPIYGCMVLTVWLGRGLGRSAAGVGGGAVLATGVFFGVSNLAFWASTALYPRDLGGLLTCYAAALPFAADMLLANVLYGVALFGLLALAERRSTLSRPVQLRREGPR